MWLSFSPTTSCLLFLQINLVWFGFQDNKNTSVQLCFSGSFDSLTFFGFFPQFRFCIGCLYPVWSVLAAVWDVQVQLLLFTETTSHQLHMLLCFGSSSSTSCLSSALVALFRIQCCCIKRHLVAFFFSFARLVLTVDIRPFLSPPLQLSFAVCSLSVRCCFCAWKTRPDDQLQLLSSIVSALLFDSCSCSLILINL